MEIILTGKPITAQRAYEIGLVNRLAEPEALIDTAIALAQDRVISEASPRSTVGSAAGPPTARRRVTPRRAQATPEVVNFALSQS